MVKIHGSHGECRKECDLYMNRECWCKFINMHQHCWGCYGQYNMTLHVQMLSIQLCESILGSVLFRVAFHLFMHASHHNTGEPRSPFQSLLLPWSNHPANGGHWQRRGMGPIRLLPTDFIPCVKGLVIVTFTWFKSLTQLNQKSMKSYRHIFGWSCQHFKLNKILMPAEQRK